MAASEVMLAACLTLAWLAGAPLTFGAEKPETPAASAELSNIEQSIRYRYWGDAIEYAEKMKEVMDGLIAEFRKGV